MNKHNILYVYNYSPVKMVVLFEIFDSLVVVCRWFWSKSLLTCIDRLMLRKTGRLLPTLFGLIQKTINVEELVHVLEFLWKTQCSFGVIYNRIMPKHNKPLFNLLISLNFLYLNYMILSLIIFVKRRVYCLTTRSFFLYQGYYYYCWCQFKL